jgi:D-aspartate ligase
LDAVVIGCTPNSLSAARSLGRAGLSVVIAAAGSDRALEYSRFVKRLECFAGNDDRAMLSRLMELPGTAGRPFLLATGDQDALVVARHQERLRAKYCFVCPSHEALEGVVNKAKLYATAGRHGIPHPRFHVVEGSGDIEAAIASVGTPCYVKPALAHEWRRVRRGKLQLAQTPDELRNILANYVELGLVAIPIEIIPGSDGDVHSVCTYISRDGGPVAWRTKRKIRQFPVDAGDGCAQEITDEPEVARLGLDLLAACGHRGPATVEFRRDARDGRFVLMEINARTILGQEMITRSGMDAPLLAYHDAMGLPLPAVGPARPVRWLFFGPDFRAFRELRRRGKLSLREWLLSLRPCRSFAYFAWDDPGPFFARLGMWLRRQLAGRTRRAQGANL